MRKISEISVKMVEDTYNILIEDEYLLRLLSSDPHSPKIMLPINPEENIIQPAQPLGEPPSPKFREMWEIIDKHVLTTSKSTDLEENRLCRLYVYLGQQRQKSNNRFIRGQEIVVDIFCHHTYEEDYRLERIISRLGDLLLENRVTGLGKIILRSAYNFSAPKEYIAYRMIFEVGRSK